MTESQAQDMISSDHENTKVLRPYLDGDSLTSLPSFEHTEYIVDFYGLTFDQVQYYSLPFRWVEEGVRPHRASLENKPRLRERWWRYESDAVSLRRVLTGVKSVLAIALVSKTVMPVRISADTLCSHQIGVFPSESFSLQAVLSSSLHQYWAVVNGSSLEGRVRYTPLSVAATFPLPDESTFLANIGRCLDGERREMMLRRQLGLTALYNLVNDPEVAPGIDADVDRLREIHTELDHVVAAAYGWDDVPLDHGFHTYRKMTRWAVSPAARVELLDRLLEENHSRAAAEAAARSSK